MRAITATVAPTARSSATVFRSTALFIPLPFFLLARIYIHGRCIRKQTGAILLSGNRQRNGPEWRDGETDGRGTAGGVNRRGSAVLPRAVTEL